MTKFEDYSQSGGTLTAPLELISAKLTNIRLKESA
jgi:hypothetical protein